MKEKQMTVKEMASLGGKARAKKLSKEERSKIGKLAISVRWKKQANKNGNEEIFKRKN